MLVAPALGTTGDIVLTIFTIIIKFSAWVMSLYLFQKEFRIYIPNFKYRIQHTIRMNFGIALNVETPVFMLMTYRFWCTLFCLIAQTSHGMELGLEVHNRYVNLITKPWLQPGFHVDSTCWFDSCEKQAITLRSLSITFNLSYWISFALLMNTILYRYERMNFTLPQQSNWVHRLQIIIWTITAIICMNVGIVNLGNTLLDKMTHAIIHLVILCFLGSLSLMGVGIDIVLSLKMIFMSLNYDNMQSLPNCGTDRAPSTLPSPDAGNSSGLPLPSALKQENISEERLNSFNSSRVIRKRLALKRDMFRLYFTLATLDILVITYFVINAIFWVNAFFIAASWLSFHIYMSFILLDYFGKSVTEIRRRRHRIHVSESDKVTVHSLIEEIIEVVLEADNFLTVSPCTYSPMIHSEPAPAVEPPVTE